MHVAGEAVKRMSVGARGRSQPAHVEVDVADLGHRPGDLLRDRRVCLERELVGGDGRVRSADELACVRDAGERRDARRLERHPVVRLEGLLVPSEVEESVS